MHEYLTNTKNISLFKIFVKNGYFPIYCIHSTIYMRKTVISRKVHWDFIIFPNTYLLLKTKMK